MKYPANLCDLPQEEQDAIELDKKLWLDANNLIKKPRQQVMRELDAMTPEAREDMRKRLNTIQRRRKCTK